MTRDLRLRLAALAAALLVALPPAASAEALQPIPPLKARVTDVTGTLSAAERESLEAKLAAFEARKGAQIAVLIVPTTKPEEIEQYSIRVVDAWKLGREKPDDGALLLVAIEDHTLRIEVGRGLEGALTDLVSNRIIDETITPRFREGDFRRRHLGRRRPHDRRGGRRGAAAAGRALERGVEEHRPAVPAAFLRHHLRLRHPARDFRPRARLGRDGRRDRRDRLDLHAAGSARRSAPASSRSWSRC